MPEEHIPDYQTSYTAWSADPSPENASTLLTHMDPIIGTAISRYAGKDDPLIRSRARRMALEAVHSYDPNRGTRLTTHVMNHLQGLRRVSRRQQQFLKVPERAAMEQAYLQRMEAELNDKLGRDPSTTELADYSAIPVNKIARLRKYVPGTPESSLPEDATVAGQINPDLRAVKIAQLLHGELPERDQKILEWSMGLYGSKQLNNMQIAEKLGVTPGAVTQRKAIIQSRLNSMHSFMDR